MKDKIKIYIIHYSKLSERKEYMNQILDNLNIDFEFIEKFDKETLKEIDLSKYYDDNEENFNNKVKLWGERANKYSRMSDSEISCTLKHLEALRLINEGSHEYNLILEDDVIPQYKNLIHEINKLIDNKNKWDVLLIGEGMGKRFRNDKIGIRRRIPFKKSFKVKHPATNCLEAYIVKKSVVQKILKGLLPVTMACDWEFAYQFYIKNMNIYWSKKSIFIQGSKDGTYKSAIR